MLTQYIARSKCFWTSCEGVLIFGLLEISSLNYCFYALKQTNHTPVFTDVATGLPSERREFTSIQTEFNYQVQIKLIQHQLARVLCFPRHQSDVLSPTFVLLLWVQLLYPHCCNIQTSHVSLALPLLGGFETKPAKKWYVLAFKNPGTIRFSA